MGELSGCCELGSSPRCLINSTEEAAIAMRIPIPLLITLSLALPAAAEPPEALTSEEDKIIYAVGVTLARSVTMLDLSEREVGIVKRGLEDQIFGRKLAVDLSEYGPKMAPFANTRKALVAKKEREASKSFLAEAAAAPGAVTTESGLIYIETKAGSGPNPGPADKIKVHYHGTLRDGRVFDSSRDRGEPASFSINRVIACWTEALQMMKVGGQATITCPADIAYGDRGMGDIKPGAALHFDVELISIE
jgi:FKBP-type peptidyl-prolyl cis-trans isomerase